MSILEFHPLLENKLLLSITSKPMPDIVDIRFANIGIGLYFYPMTSWAWGFTFDKEIPSSISRYSCQIYLPTMRIEYVLFKPKL